MSKQQPRSRPKESNIQDEEASSVLKLGEFEGVPTLSTSEAAVLISAVKAQRTKLGKPMKQTELVDPSVPFSLLFWPFPTFLLAFIRSHHLKAVIVAH